MHSTVFILRKRPDQPLMAIGVAGLSTSHLFYITNRLVDTGAEVSIIPPPQVGRKHQQINFSLQAVNGSSIAIFGYRS